MVRMTVLAGLAGVLLLGAPARAAEMQEFIKAYRASIEAETSGKLADAYKIMNALPVESEDDYPIVMRLAYLNGLMGKSEEAAKMYGTAADLRQDAVEPLLYQQYYYLYLQNWPKLQESCRTAMTRDPRNYTALTRLGYAMYMMGKYNDAAEVYARVSKMHPLDLEVMNMRGWCAYYAGRKAEAERAFHYVLVFSPSHKSALSGKAYAAKMN